MNAITRKSMFVVALSLAMAGCAAGLAAPGWSTAFMIVNGDSVQTSEAQSVLEVLRAKVPASALCEKSPSDDQPIVLLDGVVLVDGVGSLGMIPAFHVSNVSTMRGTEAVPMHGSKARNGAIVVTTRGGR